MPMLPWPIWPLAWQARLGQNTVGGSTAVLLILAVKWIHRSMLGSPFASQWRPTTVRCGATCHLGEARNLDFLDRAVMHNAFQAQVRGGLAGTARTYGVPLNDLQLLVKVFKHGKTLANQAVHCDRLALAIEQDRISFDLGQGEIK